jgi:CheY-like chemotaxis protein
VDISGTGLGLSIAKWLVEEMGGKLSLESTPGKGSSFFFTLPLARGPVGAVGVGAVKASEALPMASASASADPPLLEAITSGLMESVPVLAVTAEIIAVAAEAVAVGKEVKAVRQKNLNSPRLKPRLIRKPRRAPVQEGPSVGILIVDDEPLNCKLLSRAFATAASNLGIKPPTIALASNGQEAVYLMGVSLEPESVPGAKVLDMDPLIGQAPSFLFNLVCMDRQMPVMDGVEAARQIKALQGEFFVGAGAAAPCGALPAHVVGMSASISSSATWLAAGVDECLPKPFQMKSIERLLLSAHSRAKATAPTTASTTVSARVSEESTGNEAIVANM